MVRGVPKIQPRRCMAAGSWPRAVSTRRRGRKVRKWNITYWRICLHRGAKFAVACRDGVFGLTELIPGGLRWVTTVTTESTDTTVVELPFDRLKPVVRAKPVSLPVRFDPSCITRLQLLHSRFGDDGEPNPGYRAGAIKLLIRSIEAF